MWVETATFHTTLPGVDLAFGKREVVFYQTRALTPDEAYFF